MLQKPYILIIFSKTICTILIQSYINKTFIEISYKSQLDVMYDDSPI